MLLEKKFKERKYGAGIRIAHAHEVGIDINKLIGFNYDVSHTRPTLQDADCTSNATSRTTTNMFDSAENIFDRKILFMG